MSNSSTAYAAISQGLAGVFEKNTFLNVAEGSMRSNNGSRRSASLPPASRLARHLSESCKADGAVDQLPYCESIASTTMSFDSSLWRTNSTDSALSDNVASDPESPISETENSLEYVEEVPIIDRDVVRTPSSRPEGLPIPDEEASLQSFDHPLKSPQIMAGTTGRTPLSTTASSYTPPAANSCSPESMMASVIASAMTAIARSGAVLEVSASKNEKGDWRIVAPLRPECLCLRERALTAAKESLLAASWNGVYVLGHRYWPFHASHSGFMAKLCFVDDSADACWGLLSKGVCRKQARCSWKHPECMAKVEVALVSSDCKLPSA